ncbi:hypothetical protein GCK32_019265 [Trichostrongylus colubriformis]|uniref:Uncharacterized protein n=1 Tax=Trichostrongylus colubriformis TaxID=6319 RepID=A0AAN8IY43_TRICO
MPASSVRDVKQLVTSAEYLLPQKKSSTYLIYIYLENVASSRAFIQWFEFKHVSWGTEQKLAADMTDRFTPPASISLFSYVTDFRFAFPGNGTPRRRFPIRTMVLNDTQHAAAVSARENVHTRDREPLRWGHIPFIHSTYSLRHHFHEYDL